METTQKQQIAEKVRNFIAKYDSANSASKALSVSSGTISQVLNGKWELISDEMWRKLENRTFTGKEWNGVETRNYKLLFNLLNDSQANSNVFAIIGDAGTGKSYALKEYARANKKAYLLSCNEYWNRKYFLSELLKEMGRDYSGLTVAEMMQEAVRYLQTQEAPVIIMDEADKLTDQVLYFFITLYNSLEDQCGLVLCATDHLHKRIKRGLNLNKRGYKEIYSRIGRKPIELRGINSTDVAQICVANGVTDSKLIKEVFEDCDGDLRRVKRKVYAIKMKNIA